MLITRLWKNQPGQHFCVSTKSATKKWVDTFFARNELNEVEAFCERNRDKDIYFCPHGFTKPERKKPYTSLPKLLWADLDERDPRKVKIKPTIAIESSPGRYVGLWVVDRPVTEALNRRLSYYLGSDKSGWDLTQVLRMPGTTNYKYAANPRVKIIWSDGPEYTVDELERKVPREEAIQRDAGEESDAAAVFKKWERKLPAWCRRELMAGKPTPGKRSEMLWKLEQTLIEKGLSTGEALVLIKASPWNKFRGRRNEDEQLRRELDKAVNHHLKTNRAAIDDDDEDGNRLLFRSMDEVEEEEIDWIYYPYLARGELTILEGDPGLGKSYLMQMICSHICDGKRLPSVKKHMKPVKGRIVYFDVENSSGTVTKKRLVDNGTENLKDFVQVEEPFSIDDEDALDEIYEYFDKERPVVAVWDTINTYIGGADAFKSHEVQQTLINFTEIAKRFNCAVVVLRHLTKSGKERALYRGQGSIAFTGLARVVITVGQMPEDEDLRAMAVTKINVAPQPQALTFSIVALPDTIKRQNRSKFEWGEFVDATSDEIINTQNVVTGEKKAAVEFLEDVLDEGEMELKRIEKMAEARSINNRTLRRAADELGVQKRVSGFGSDRIAFWRLPSTKPGGSSSRDTRSQRDPNRVPHDQTRGRRLH